MSKRRHYGEVTLDEIKERIEFDPFGGCWLWAGAVTGCGYGYIHRQGVNMMAHRASFAAAKGPIPVGMLVLHDCDIPLCVNPAHLHLGTDKLNAEERNARGRTRVGIGERQHKAKLTVDLVRELRRRYAAGEPRQAIADAFGISYSRVGQVGSGREWRHVK